MRISIKKILFLTLLFTIVTSSPQKLEEKMKYFYNQIPVLSKKFYGILEDLYVTNDTEFFKDGKKEVNLADHGFSQSEIDMYSFGSMELLYAFRTAHRCFQF